MNLISCAELKKKMDLREEFKLVNAMAEAQFQAAHIPGSLNVYEADEIEKFLAVDDEIIVYCSDEACNRSIILYQRLDEYGYKKKYRFAGGLRAWQEAGYTLQGEMIK